MVVRVIDEPIVGIDDSLGVSITALVVDIAFEPFAIWCIGKHVVIVVETTAPDAHAGEDIP